MYVYIYLRSVIQNEMYFRGDTIQKPHIYYIIYIYVLYVVCL